MARPTRTGGKARKSRTRRAPTAKDRAHKAKRIPTSPLKRPKPPSNPAFASELQEAREQQAATADILKVIARSPSDVKPVFAAIVGSAKRLLGGFSAAVFRFFDGT